MPNEEPQVVELSTGSMGVESLDLWGWDNDKTQALATSSPQGRRLEFEVEGQTFQLGLMSVTHQTPIVQTAEGVFSPKNDETVHLQADEVIVTIVNPRVYKHDWSGPMRGRINFRKSNR